MIFLIVLTVVAVLFIAAWFFADEIFGVVGVFVLVVGLLGTFMGAYMTPNTSYQEVRTETYSLQALDTRESSAGRYFLSSGYNNGQPGFNYIREGEDENTYVMRFSQNWQATITTDEEEAPYVDVVYYLGFNWVWVPWAIEDFWNTEFHVPENAVSNNIEVKP